MLVLALQFSRCDPYGCGACGFRPEAASTQRRNEVLEVPTPSKRKRRQ